MAATMTNPLGSTASVTIITCPKSEEATPFGLLQRHQGVQQQNPSS